MRVRRARVRRAGLEAVGPSDATARFAPEKIERVLLNLLTNALRHTPTDGSVAVVVKPSAAELCVRVEDTGEGIDDEGVERMFERFWRGDQARSTPGAGLGLAIVPRPRRSARRAHLGRAAIGWTDQGVVHASRLIRRRALYHDDCSIS